MKTEHKRIANCFIWYLGGGDYRYYKIVDEEDLLEGVKDERTGQEKVQRVNKDRTGPVKVKEITPEEYHRMKEEAANNGKNQEG